MTDPRHITLRFLGTGTSTGVPMIGCNCEVCTSPDSRDHRLRTSALVSIGSTNLLIDCGPDFRQQMLLAGSPHIDALLITHHHYDHLGGIDDLRPYCTADKGFPIYCTADVARRIHTLMPYCFEPNRYPGAPRLDLHIIDTEPFFINGIKITPIPVMHTETLSIRGYRIGGLCYLTDAKKLLPETYAALADCDTLVINALRHKPHRSHLSLRESLDVISVVKPRQAYLTHMSHDMGLHAQVSKSLPDNVRFAYDGLRIQALNKFCDI